MVGGLRLFALVALALMAAPSIQAQSGRDSDEGSFPAPKIPALPADFSGFVVPGAFPGSDRVAPGGGTPAAGQIDLDILAGAHIGTLQGLMGDLVAWLLGPPTTTGTRLPPVGAPFARPVVAPPRALPADGEAPLPSRRVYWVRVPAQPLTAGGPTLSGRRVLESRLAADGRPVEAIVAELGGTVHWASAGITGELEAGPAPGGTAITGELEVGVDDVISALAGIVGELEDLAISSDELDLRALNGGGAATIAARDAMVGLLEALAPLVDGLTESQRSRVSDLLDILLGITGELEDLLLDFETLSELVATSL